MYLTTIGRKTGLAREIEIWFTVIEGRYYLVAETRERAHWVQNLLVIPRVSVRVKGRTVAARARVVDPDLESELNRRVQAASSQKYGWGNGLVVEIVPDH